MTIEEAKIAFTEKGASRANQAPICFWWTRLRLVNARFRTAEPDNTSGRLQAEFAGLFRLVLDLLYSHGNK